MTRTTERKGKAKVKFETRVYRNIYGLLELNEFRLPDEKFRHNDRVEVVVRLVKRQPRPAQRGQKS